MTQIWVIASGFILAYVLLFLRIWNNVAYTNKNINYINNSLEEEFENEVNKKSLVLRTMGNYLKSILANFIKKEGKENKDLLNKSHYYIPSLDSQNESQFSKKNVNLLNIFKEKYNKYLNSKKNNKMISNASKLENMMMLVINKIIYQQQKISNENTFANDFFNKNKLNIGNENKIKLPENSKISLFLDREKKNIYILSIFNEEKIEMKQRNNHIKSYNGSKVSLYAYSLEKLIGKKSFTKDGDKNIKIHKSQVKSCFESYFYGKVIGAVASNDKKRICIAYKVELNKKNYYRIRYFHNIFSICNNKESTNIKKDLSMYENKLNTEFLTLFEKQEEHTTYEYEKINNEKIYFEISEDEKNNHESFSDGKLSNQFSEILYDDFSLEINFPIKAMAIKNHLIAFTTDKQNFEYTIIKRENDQITQKPVWKVFSHGPILDREEYQFFHTNSLKFLEEEATDDNTLELNLIQVSTKIKKTDYNYNKITNNKACIEAYTSGDIRRILNINFEKYFENQNKEINFMNNNLLKEINDNQTINIFNINLLEELEKDSNLNPQVKKIHFDKYATCGNFKPNSFIQSISKFLRPNIYSNNSFHLNKKSSKEKSYYADSFLVEIQKGNLIQINSNLNAGVLNTMKISDENKKIEKLYSDADSSNVFIVNNLEI